MVEPKGCLQMTSPNWNCWLMERRRLTRAGDSGCLFHMESTGHPSQDGNHILEDPCRRWYRTWKGLFSGIVLMVLCSCMHQPKQDGRLTGTVWDSDSFESEWGRVSLRIEFADSHCDISILPVGQSGELSYRRQYIVGRSGEIEVLKEDNAGIMAHITIDWDTNSLSYTSNEETVVCHRVNPR